MKKPEHQLSNEYPRDYKHTARLLAYLLRATMMRASADKLGIERYRSRGRELADCLYPLLVSERNLVGMYRALCQRFDIDATGSDTAFGPIEAWLPEGYVRWDRALAMIDLRVARMVVHDLSDLLATFATSKESEVDELVFDGLDAPTGGAWTPTLPSRLIAPTVWRTVWTLTSPLAHGHDMKFGNVVMFRRQREIDPVTGQAVDVPFVSGNAVRGLWRRIVMGRFLSLVGLKIADIPPARAHALFSGGNVEAGADSAAVLNDVRRRARELCPPWDLLAGCIEQQVMSGRLRVHDAVLVCKETAWRVHEVVAPSMPFDEFRASLPEAATLTTLRLATRHRDRDIPEGDGIQMLWNTEVLQTGCQLVHSFCPYSLDGVSEVTLSCLADLLADFSDNSTIGAGNARGYGLIAFEPYRAFGGKTELPSPQIYLDYVASRREEIRTWLLEVPQREPPQRAQRRRSQSKTQAEESAPESTSESGQQKGLFNV